MTTADTDPEDLETRAIDTALTMPPVGKLRSSEPSGLRPPPRAGMGLSTRFFLAAAALVFATLGVALVVTSWRANLVAEEKIRTDLERAPAMMRAYRADLEERLKAQLSSLAAEPGTKSLFAPDVSAATLWEFAREHALLLSAKTVWMFDFASRVLARSDKPEGEGRGRPFGAVKWVQDPLWNHRDSAAAIVDQGELAVVASVAVVSGEGEEARVDGVLAASFPLGLAEAERLEGILGGSVAFVTNRAKEGETPEPVVTSSSAGIDAQALLASLAANDAIEQLLVQGREVGPLATRLGSESHLLLGVPIVGSAGKPYGAFVVARSRAAELAPFREIQKALLAIGIVLLALSFPVSFLLGRRIARPIEQLTAGAHKIREGELDVALPEERTDEVGSLARAFKAMVGELREKRALQELLEEMGRRGPAEPSTESTLQTAPTAEMAALPGAELTIGKLFGTRYEILGSLGRGGMGQVYHARDVELDDAVAIKVLRSEALAAGSQALEVLKREIRLARKITHPNVVRVHDFAEAEGIRFVSMEYCPGTTLRSLIRREPMAVGPGLQIAKQLYRGLAAIHQAGILHRDMKPENVMVLPNGMVKLMDFGIAEVLDGSKQLKTGTVVGTPRYMSPEQLRGEQLDGRSDIYSAGMMVYEMFTGVPLFHGRNLTEIVQKKVATDPEPLQGLRADLPQSLTGLVMSCLARASVDRPAEAKDVYRRLLEVSM